MSEETFKDIKEEIDDNIHGPSEGFIEKHFGGFQYEWQESSLVIRQAGNLCGRYSVPPAAPLPDQFVSWFRDFAAPQSGSLQGSWRILDREEPLKSDLVPGADVRFVLETSKPAPFGEQAPWCSVQVVGQFCQGDCVSYADGLACLSQSALKVFINQPTRLFVHGIYMRGPIVDLWVFNRSGLFFSHAFDLRQNFNDFLSKALSYQFMTSSELGQSQVLGADDDGLFIQLKEYKGTPSRKLRVESRPFVNRKALVGTNTVCYRAKDVNSRDWQYALKFKWERFYFPRENERMEMIREKGAWGAVSVDYYEEVIDTNSVRQGIRWRGYRKFATPSNDHDGSKDDTDTRPAVEPAELTKPDTPIGDYTRLVFYCLLTSPLGRGLDTFKSNEELLRVLRDAIKCQKSLFLDAKLLHRDISDGNIVIVEDGEHPRGVLIDVDIAIDSESTSERRCDICGTCPYMAIGAHRGQRRIHRHDLESFLYLLLSMIITKQEGIPADSKLQRWRRQPGQTEPARELFAKIALIKEGDMAEDVFGEILDEFGADFACLKPLARELRQILFPLRDGAIWTGTDESPEATHKLYDDVTAAFDRAILALEDQGPAASEAVCDDKA